MEAVHSMPPPPVTDYAQPPQYLPPPDNLESDPHDKDDPDDLFDGALTDNLIKSLKEATNYFDEEGDSASPASSARGENPNSWMGFDLVPPPPPPQAAVWGRP
jgi:hypothetical protein